MKRFALSRGAAIGATHVGLVSFAYLLAFLLRFDFHLSADQWDRFLHTLPFLLLIRMAVFAWFHLYEGLWHYVSMRDILMILKAVTLSSLIFLAGVLVFFGHGYPRSVFLLDWILCLALVGGVRLTIRALRETTSRYGQVKGKRAIIVGAGDAGEMLIREIERSRMLSYDVVGFVDDDLRKQGRQIHGIKVVGTVDQIPVLSRSWQAQEVLIAVPSATGEQRRRIIERCRESGMSFKTVPPINDLLQGMSRIGQLQEVRPEDLLGRVAVHLDIPRLKDELEGKRILITGAGGSIGFELCRQVATFEPELLILFDQAESSLYFADLELRRRYRHLQVMPVVGDIQSGGKVEEVMRAYVPDLVYHAAAYKHVPLMEGHPLEAIENNIFGTRNVALAARQMGVKKFVFISTDKAVSPVGIMGMTKRVAECLVLGLDGDPTIFVGVRFGNVLGSDGSVLPVFQWQIATGEPVTLTDTEVSRYFMLRSEAAQLVLQAGAMGKGGEVFFLDMGEPIRVLDLAENLIRASGMEPGKDIPIELIGLRPGERLHEELVKDQCDLISTNHEKIFVVKDHHFDLLRFGEDLDGLQTLVSLRDRQQAVEKLKIMASRY